MRRNLVCGLFWCLFLIVSGCSYREEKSRGTAQEPVRTGTISFAKIEKEILRPNCLGCHSGSQSPQLLTYAEVKENLQAIRREVLEKKTMPKRGPLAEAELALLQTWIENGAPEFVSETEGPAGPSPTPPNPTPNERPVVRWTDLQDRVIKPNCLTCHFKGNPGKLSNLEDKEVLKTSIGSVHFLTVVSPRMPPPPMGAPVGAPNPNQLTREEKELISYWIVDGMQP
jgi:hypothetical protein